MTVRDIGTVNALLGGFSTFFSAWQLCLMQITPFFLAFAAVIYLLRDDGKIMRPMTGLFLAGAGYILAFSAIFAFRGTSGYWTASYIIYNLEDFHIAAATVITLVSLLAMISGVIGKGDSIRHLFFPMGMGIGFSFAIVYSPCIPPVLSDIMNFAGKPANALRGLILMSAYGAGMSVAFLLAGVVLSVVVGRLTGKKIARKAAIIVASSLLLVMVLMVVSGVMTTYKSFLVGLVLD